MGYPMTYQRVINRNGLATGDYNQVSERYAKRVNITEPAAFTYVAKRVEEYEKQATLLLGDLRRLENDTVDENQIAKQITRKTGIDSGIVAAVLREYMNL